MRILFISLFTIFCFFCFSCPLHHIYDEDVVGVIEFEGDACCDEHFCDQDLKAQMIYGIDPPNPQKILQQASYAFETFRYNKCLEKIKEYERAAFPPPYDFPSSEEKLVILAYKAYSNRFLKRYDSAIHYFDEMIRIIKETDYLAPECRFITYFEQAQCYLLKGDKKEFQSRIKKIIDSDIAPRYEYYVKNNFKIHHQPCFHHHDLKEEERMMFSELAPIAIGKELYALLEERGETPKKCVVAKNEIIGLEFNDSPFTLDYFAEEAGGITTRLHDIKPVGKNERNTESCRRLCARASYLSAIIVGCITKRKEAMAAAAALGELLVDCDVCCNEGWGSENCCRDLKWVFKQGCLQYMLDGL